MLRRSGRGFVTPLARRVEGGRFAGPLELVRAALDGDARARDCVIEELACVPTMVRIKCQRLGGRLSAHELDDVAQNVLLAVWRKLAQWDGRAPLEHWAYGFVAIELLKTLERRARRAAVEQIGDTALAASPAAAGGEVDGERLGLAVAQLEAGDQEIVRLKHHEELTFDEIAARLAVSANTVKTRYYRAIQRLRGLLCSVEEVTG
ncbi:MAG: sigma-70 family RNA polymerase sigma factor [Planctomycetes bacterium]|nr:sigma-70 family RNA polymerase sigma factor [Planctomycetota bacterium]